jgi:hypothetical protein
MTDRDKQLQRAFPHLKIDGNTLTDQPLPSSKGRVYYFKARLRNDPHPYHKVYTPRNIEKLDDVGMTFGEFLGLSRDARERLLRSIKQ